MYHHLPHIHEGKAYQIINQKYYFKRTEVVVYSFPKVQPEALLLDCYTMHVAAMIITEMMDSVLSF